jgi:hypothetical protein
MRAEAWERLIDRLIVETESGRLNWRSGDVGQAAVAATPRGSFVIRYTGGLGAPSRPLLEVRDADGTVLDRLASQHPMTALSRAVSGEHPVLPAPSEAEVESLLEKLRELVATIRRSSDRIEAEVFDILP